MGVYHMVKDLETERRPVSSIWVGELRISAKTATKLSSKHGLRACDVRDAVQCVYGLPFAWDYHPERGWRVIIKAVVARRQILVVLYPVDDPIGDVWNLGSAYYISR
jgi:hypothetical protein